MEARWGVLRGIREVLMAVLEFVQWWVAAREGSPAHQAIHLHCIQRVLGWWYFRGIGADMVDDITRNP